MAVAMLARRELSCITWALPSQSHHLSLPRQTQPQLGPHPSISLMPPPSPALLPLDPAPTAFPCLLPPSTCSPPPTTTTTFSSLQTKQ